MTVIQVMSVIICLIYNHHENKAYSPWITYTCFYAYSDAKWDVFSKFIVRLMFYSVFCDICTISCFFILCRVITRLECINWFHAQKTLSLQTRISMEKGLIKHDVQFPMAWSFYPWDAIFSFIFIHGLGATVGFGQSKQCHAVHFVR